MSKFDDTKNISNPSTDKELTGWVSGRFLCPFCFYTGGYVFEAQDYHLECPACEQVSHTDDCIIKWFPYRDDDDETA